MADDLSEQKDEKGKAEGGSEPVSEGREGREEDGVEEQSRAAHVRGGGDSEPLVPIVRPRLSRPSREGTGEGLWRNRAFHSYVAVNKETRNGAAFECVCAAPSAAASAAAEHPLDDPITNLHLVHCSCTFIISQMPSSTCRS